MNSTVPIFEAILNRTVQIPVLIYAGDMDIIDGPVTQEAWIYEMNWKGLSSFDQADRNLYYYHPDNNPESLKVGGYYKNFGSFHYLVVHSAGHLVPSTQLSMSRHLLHDFVTFGEYHCYNPDGCSIGEEICKEI